jgi:hypothetical protein
MQPCVRPSGHGASAMSIRASRGYAFQKKERKKKKKTKGVFGLTFGFGFCPPISQKPTKGLDLGSSFF